MGLRYYANAPATTLASSCTNVSTTIVVTATTGFPVSYPFTLILDRGLASEEVVSVTGAAGTTLTVTRGYDSTTGFAHSAGASVSHGISAIEPREANTHVNAVGAVHGLTGSVVGTSDSQTLTTKTISLGSNTVSGTTAQFNTALSDNDFTTLAGTETLTNKTLTSPKVNQINDTNGNEEIIFVTTGSAVNEITVTNAATAGKPKISATGGDTNITLNLVPKGTGTVQANGVDLVTTTGTQTVTGKTINLTDNTLEGTRAQFNTALSDENFATQGAIETLTNKTLGNPTTVGAGTEISGAWTSYTPALTNWALGNGTITGAYMQIGKTVHYRITFTAGSTSTFVGTCVISLPVTGVTRTSRTPLGQALCNDTSVPARFLRYAGFNAATSILLADEGGALVNATVPFTWTTSDIIEVSGTYEAA